MNSEINIKINLNDKMSTQNETSNEPILYELLEYFVREQEPELIKCKNDTVVLPATGTIKNALRYLNNRYSLPESISHQVSLTLSWKFAVGDHGRVLAILQENIIEIRKAKDEYSSIIGKTSAPKDAFPQWRKLAWSPDGMILVLASSTGYTSFYNILGNNIFNISPKTISQNPYILEAGDAIASMLFLKTNAKNEKWTYEFILITYSGLLRSYYISTTGFSANYDFSFSNFYKNGINAVVYDEKRHLFYVAGNMITQKLTSTASESGLTSWRPLNDYPYCKLSFAFEDSVSSKSRFSIWNLIPSFSFQLESVIFTIKISPNGECLVCLHTDGSVSLWGLPNLILQRKWKLSEQPEHNIPNPLGLTKCKKFPPGFTEFHPVDIGWWSDQAIIIARYSGSTSVCSAWYLKNLLGISPEFLMGQPQVCELGSEKGFLCLDCETFITSKKRSRESSDSHLPEASSESEKDDDELEPMTILNYTTNLVQSTLYSITDIERFQPKRKKLKVLRRTYRILGLKSTTPEELYSRKIDIEEYEEALALANTYNLDTDLVYQTQWRKSKLSLNAIAEHLSKVSKRSWVLNECIMRVPDTIEAARELLNFGLRGANLETLIAIDICDNDKFVIPDAEDDWQSLDEDSATLRQMQKINEMLEQVDINNLSEAQKNLIKYRRKLLSHLDKLLTYEIILQPPLQYEKEFYEKFRRLSAIENAIIFAKDGDYRGVEIMFTYYGESLIPHWLAIISFFPETLNPSDYQKLLPECDSEGQLFLLNQCELRQKDWSEKLEFNEVINLDADDRSEILYELDPSLSIYKNTQLTPELLQKWYKMRAYEIEKNSSMVDNALQLIKIAKAHKINGMEDLLLDLETLDDLVYKVYLENISLYELEKLSNVKKIKLLMSTSTESNFVENIRNLLLPFIKRRHQYLGGNLEKHLLSDYLICLSKDDLMLPVKFFKYLKLTQEAEIIQMIDDVTILALDCICACDDPNMYEKAREILDSLPNHDGHRTNATGSLVKDVIDELFKLGNELYCTKVLSKYDVKTTLKFIRKHKSDPVVAESLLIQMARSLNNQFIPSDENKWQQLLSDMLVLRGILPCIEVVTCFEIYVSARLVSGVKSIIQNCSTLIQTKRNEKSPMHVSYEKAIDLILEATKEYFNSSKTLNDPNMELAKACLLLMEDDNAKIKEEYDLIKSLQILNEFNVDILPLQVRLTVDRLSLIERCLNNQRDAYKSRQRLLMLAAYLRIEGNKNKLREGKVLELIAKKAVETENYSTCATICTQLTQSNYLPAWEICLNLGRCDNYQDLKVRQKCLWFAINNGPSDILGNALEHMYLIEIQMLHKHLELWMPSVELEGSRDEESDESEDHFTDAMTTPQVEVKEFVPKMLETSTEIVKSSASIMRKSTFHLIKNISDTSFWKSRLKFNFANDLETDDHYEDAEEQNETSEDANRQSFPCYYESLHGVCKKSANEPRYNKYSMPDIENTKLKCCRALLRITMLSESSCYGLEISDIDHLLLECAKHTIQDDWLLGMSYLLSLNKDHIMDVQKIFTNLPRNELYIQTALYYYLLKLYKKLYTDCEKLYLYSPLNLITKMTVVARTTEECDIVEALQYWQSYLLGGAQVAKTEEMEKRYRSMLQVEQSSTCIRHEETAKKFIIEEQESVEHVDINDTLIANSDEDEESTGVIVSNEIDIVDVNNTPIANFSENGNLNKITAPDEIDTIGWTDDWGDFSDDNMEATSDKEHKINSEETMREETVSFLSPIHGVDQCVTEEDRFKLFHRLFNQIDHLERYRKLKKIITEWPKFNMPDHIRLDNHPILKMMKAIIPLITNANETDFEKRILQEHEELIGLLASKEILRQFVEAEQDHISFEESLYIRLCSDDVSMQKEAVNLIKQRQQAITLLPLVLEKLFLNDLTALFPPNHAIYNQIIEHVFMNESLVDIEKNARSLIQELKKRKYILEALNIIRLMEKIPTALCTFDVCFQLLMED
ncbi:neuroblastoma-amplified sequence-like isoform X1 [Harpegnathos saltator]|uniref:neuroblastoma-amplified sequence-like isoform X1 n=2 Tax=Harpegnathos saltator TaxID=610380 RepID=UPI00058C891B|nr:neuroblastoma-amplified sequence-like isoform X1 [Harpegnathos saltator]